MAQRVVCDFAFNDRRRFGDGVEELVQSIDVARAHEREELLFKIICAVREVVFRKDLVRAFLRDVLLNGGGELTEISGYIQLFAVEQKSEQRQKVQKSVERIARKGEQKLP